MIIIIKPGLVAVAVEKPNGCLSWVRQNYPMLYLFCQLHQGTIYWCVTDNRGNSGDLFSLTHR